MTYFFTEWKTSLYDYYLYTSVIVLTAIDYIEGKCCSRNKKKYDGVYLKKDNINGENHVSYRFMNKTYIAIERTSLNFPLYPADMNTNDIEKPNLLFAHQEDGTDITNIVEKYAGPLNDFHASLQQVIYLKDISNQPIRLTDTMMNEHYFSKPNQRIFFS